MNQTDIFQILFLNSWRPFLWITLLSFAVYGHVIFFSEYTYYDDSYLIKDYYSRIDELGDIGQQFLEDVGHQAQGGNLYRPILNISFILSAKLSGIDLWGHYLVNILLHIVACSLLFILQTTLSISRARSFIFSLLFTVHPALSQSVAWISGRNDPLLAIFILLSFITFISYYRSPSYRIFFLHLLFFCLAIFTKETAIFFPFLLLVYLVAIQSRRQNHVQVIPFIAGWCMIIVNWQLLRYLAKIAPLTDAGAVIKSTLSNLWIVFSYFGKIFWPFELSYAPVKQDISILPGIIAAALLLILVVRYSKNQWRMILFGILWFGLFLVPTFIHHPGKEYSVMYYEHRLYVPMIGIVLLLSTLSFIQQLRRVRILLPLFLGALILFFGWWSYRHTYHFQNFFTLRQYAAETSPHDILQYSPLERMSMPPLLSNLLQNYNCSSDTTQDESKLHTARTRAIIEVLEQQLNVQPPSEENYHSLAIVYYGRGFLINAERFFQAAKTLDSNDAGVFNNLGILYFDGRRFREAEEEWLTATRIKPTDGNAYLNLTYLYYQQARYEDAWANYKQAVKFGMNVPYGLMAEINRMHSLRQ
ncbi:MAG: hypothetical protein V1799_11925 [bacterium]